MHLLSASRRKSEQADQLLTCVVVVVLFASLLRISYHIAHYKGKDTRDQMIISDSVHSSFPRKEQISQTSECSYAFSHPRKAELPPLARRYNPREH